MSPRHLPPIQNDPLTPDERTWASRLAQIGPHADSPDGPPPALDARILAAARAAVAHPGDRPNRPVRRAARHRWPTLVGAAASLVIVVGLAWQLQPLLRSRPSVNEGPVAAAPTARRESSLSADVLAAAEPVARRAVATPPSAAAPATDTTTAKYHRPPPPPVAAAEPSPAPAQRPTAFGEDAVPPYAEYAGQAAARKAAAQPAANDATSRAWSDERRERAAAMSPQPFARDGAATDAAMPAAPSPPAAATASSPRRTVDAPLAATRGLSRAPAPEPSAAAARDNATLDRIEVSGTRIRPGDLPVREDARLEAAAWLQRIRDRRDAGDLDGARESLELFVTTHPLLRVPDDLAPLGR